MEKLPNANHLIRDFFKEKENASVLNKAKENNFWEKVSEGEGNNIVNDFSNAEREEKNYFKITIPRSKMWLLVRARPATDKPEIYAYELKFQMNAEDALQSVALFDDPIFTKYAVVVIENKVRMGQGTNSVSFDPTPYLEKLKAEIAKS